MRFIAFLICMLVCSTVRGKDAESAPDTPLRSPRGTFTIEQHGPDFWHATIHFKHGPRADIRPPEEYPWPALFYISPDDQWILQVQKSGSGDNISFLWRVESAKRIRRMEPGIGALALAFVERQGLAHVKDLYHTGITFDAWDLSHHRVAFTVHGASVEHSGEGIDIPLIYDIKNHRVQRR
jgi:hypothetical protein